MSFRVKLDSIFQRYQDLEHILSQKEAHSAAEFADQSREYTYLIPLVKEIIQLQMLEKEKQDLENMENIEDDPELKHMAIEESAAIVHKLSAQELVIRTLLLPKDEDDSRNVIMEIRAGTGGDEAALFVVDLLRMYQRYAESKGWAVELMQSHESDRGGIKEIGFAITGKDVFSQLKFEAGVHRVQRVPETEANGRIPTSTATVAVLPEVEEVDIHIEEKDLRIDVFRSSGPGGQSVNTTDSAVRVTHIPTGVVVQQQDEKSQHKNKAKALKILRARLYEKKKAENDAERATSRSQQIGRGDRCERIRTYNFPQGRVTDHRIKLTLYKLPQILEGPGLDEMVESLIADDRAQQLSHNPLDS